MATDNNGTDRTDAPQTSATGTPPAIVVLGRSALPVARRIQAACAGASVHGLRARVEHEAEVGYDRLGDHLQMLYAQRVPIIALFAAGIVIRSLAPLLDDKRAEPPVLAVAEDGSAVVPLLGGLAGANALARDVARALQVAPAITTSGELRFGTCLLNPPKGYVLADLERGKHFVSDLLAGEPARIEGDAPWLRDAPIPQRDDARLTIRVTPLATATRGDELVIHPRSVVACVPPANGTALRADDVLDALSEHGFAVHALAALLAPAARRADASLAHVAQALRIPLRFADAPQEVAQWLADSPNARYTIHRHANGIALALAPAPVDPSLLGERSGRVSVVGLGPGSAGLLAPDARAALDAATDILGYATYVDMAGPFRAAQRVHRTDNREELQRARHAFELACEGRDVVVVSSGDPGVFAMAAAVFEALDTAPDPRWHSVELRIVPGVSAAMAAAAKAGAPLGHDFCVLSLSDNLKPWSVIEKRVAHAAQADLVIALYNPVSRARPWQFERALDIMRQWRAPGTRVVLGRDIGRPAEALTTTTLGDLHTAQADMRTIVIVGSSATRGVKGGPNGEWIYTPRWYRE